VGNDEAGVVTLPRPASCGGADKIETKEDKPEIEPGRAIDVGAGDAGTESGFEESGGGTNPGEGNEKEHSQMDRAEGVNGSPNGGVAASGLDLLFTRFGQWHPWRIEGTGGRTRGATLHTGYSLSWRL